MSVQPRNAHTGQFGQTAHSAPEVSLAPPTEDERLAKVLENVSVCFSQLESIAARGPDAFFDDNDFVLRMATVGVLIRLGEQARHLGEEFIADNPEPRYKSMGRQRDFLAHNFTRVQWKLIWRTVSDTAPRAARAHLDVEQRFLMRARRRAAE